MSMRLTLATMIILATAVFGLGASVQAADCPKGYHSCGDNTCCQD